MVRQNLNTFARHGVFELDGMAEGPERDAAIEQIRREIAVEKQRVLDAGGLFVLGTERPSYSTDSGFTSIYSAYISWSTPATPAPKEIFPQQAFDQLFDDGSKRKRDKSILDLVLEDAGALKPKLSQRDKQKLDEYLTSVREIEQRVELAEKISQAETKGTGWQPTVKVPTMQRPGAGIPTSAEDHLRLMFDIMLLAFQMDRTRVATFMSAHGFSRQNFTFLDGVKNDHHGMSHHKNQEALVKEYTTVSRWYAQQVQYLLTKMRGIDEGNGSLLDNSIVLYGSEMKDGNGHIKEDLPLVLIGKGQGKLQTGRHLVCPKGTPLANLHLTLLHKFGIQADHFNENSSGTIGGLG